MHVLVQNQGLVMTNTVSDEETDVVIDTLNERCFCSKLQGHVLVDFKEEENWDVIDWVKEKLQEVAPDLLDSFRTRFQYSFALSGGEGKSNPVIRDLSSEYTVHAFATDTSINRSTRRSMVVSPEMIQKRIDTNGPFDDYDIIENGTKKTYSFYSPVLSRNTGMFASARIIKYNEKKNSAAFIIEFHMIRRGRDEKKEIVVSQQTYTREFMIPTEPGKSIGLLGYVGRNISGVYGQLFDNLCYELETVVMEKLIPSVCKADVPAEVLEAGGKNFKGLSTIVTTFPNMVTNFQAFGYPPQLLQWLQKQFPNVDYFNRGQLGNQNYQQNPRYPGRKEHPVYPTEYIIAPEGLTSELMPKTLKVKVPVDYKNCLVKTLSLIYAIEKLENAKAIEADAKNIEVALRKNVDLLKVVPVEERSQGAQQQNQRNKGTPHQRREGPKPPPGSMMSILQGQMKESGAAKGAANQNMAQPPKEQPKAEEPVQSVQQEAVQQEARPATQQKEDISVTEPTQVDQNEFVQSEEMMPEQEVPDADDVETPDYGADENFTEEIVEPNPVDIHNITPPPPQTPPNGTSAQGFGGGVTPSPVPTLPGAST